MTLIHSDVRRVAHVSHSGQDVMDMTHVETALMNSTVPSLYVTVTYLNVLTVSSVPSSVVMGMMTAVMDQTRSAVDPRPVWRTSSPVRRGTGVYRLGTGVTGTTTAGICPMRRTVN